MEKVGLLQMLCQAELKSGRKKSIMKIPSISRLDHVSIRLDHVDFLKSVHAQNVTDRWP